MTKKIQNLRYDFNGEFGCSYYDFNYCVSELRKLEHPLYKSYCPIMDLLHGKMSQRIPGLMFGSEDYCTDEEYLRMAVQADAMIAEYMKLLSDSMVKATGIWDKLRKIQRDLRKALDEFTDDHRHDRSKEYLEAKYDYDFEEGASDECIDLT